MCISIFSKVFKSIYIYMLLAFVIFLSSAVVVFAQGHGPIMQITGTWQYQWTDSPKNEQGDPIWINDATDNPVWKPLGESRQPLNLQKQKVMWMRVNLPEGNWKDPSIYLTVNDQIMDVYFDGKHIGSFGTIDSNTGKIASPRYSQQILQLPDNAKNKMLYFRIYSPYNAKAGYMREVQIGSKDDILQYYNNRASSLVRENIDYIIFGSLFIFIGLALIFIFFLRKKEQAAFFSLGFSSIAIGTWVIANSELTILFVNAPAILTCIAVISLELMPAGFCAFVEQIVDTKYRSILRYMWCFYIAYPLLTLILDLTNVASIMDTLRIFHLSLGITIFILLWSIIKAALAGNKEAKTIAFGITILSFCGIYDVVDMFYIEMPLFKGHHITPWGMLIFVLTLVSILGQRFIAVHDKLKVYSKEIETKNLHLDSMWKKVKASRDSIADLNKTLEKRVIERTTQLEAANSELTEALETLRKTQVQLVQSEKMVALGSLVAGIAHEINTPIGIGVTAASHLEQKAKEFLELYKGNAIKKSEFEKYLHTSVETSGMILANLQRSSDLIKSFKQVAVDQSSEEKRIFNVRQYIEEILLSLSPRLKKTNHYIEINCDDNLQIDSYPGALSQIVTNLVMNSLTHAYGDDDKGIIAFDISEVDGQLLFNYFDTGKGISKQHLGKIFDPFFTTKRGKGGTGLGLNIVYNIVTQTFGGTIKCESEVGKGTAFIISFPLKEGDVNGNR